MLKQGQIKQKIEEYNITITDLEEYRSSRPHVDKINRLESKLFDKEIEIDSKGRVIKVQKLKLWHQTIQNLL